MLGEHHLVELLGCDRGRLARVETVRPVLERAVRDSGAEPLRFEYHQFDPEGVTAIVLVKESHFALHTWPEHGYAGLDIFTCGTMDPALAVRILAEGLGARRVESKVHPRGVPR